MPAPAAAHVYALALAPRHDAGIGAQAGRPGLSAGRQGLHPGFCVASGAIVVVDETMAAVAHAIVKSPAAAIARTAVDQQISGALRCAHFAQATEQQASHALAMQMR